MLDTQPKTSFFSPSRAFLSTPAPVLITFCLKDLKVPASCPAPWLTENPSWAHQSLGIWNED